LRGGKADAAIQKISVKLKPRPKPSLKKSLDSRVATLLAVTPQSLQRDKANPAIQSTPVIARSKATWQSKDFLQAEAAPLDCPL